MILQLILLAKASLIVLQSNRKDINEISEAVVSKKMFEVQQRKNFFIVIITLIDDIDWNLSHIDDPHMQDTSFGVYWSLVEGLDHWSLQGNVCIYSKHNVLDSWQELEHDLLCCLRNNVLEALDQYETFFFSSLESSLV